MKTEKKTYKIRLTTKMLGTVPKNKSVYTTYIGTLGSNSDEEEQTVEEIEDSGWTGFHKDDNGLFIYSYMVLGFLKNSLQVLMESGTIKKIPAYKKWIDSLVFINPRRIHFGKFEPDGNLERPIRVMTPKGPRVSVVRSDYIAEGQEIEFEVEIFKNTKGINHKTIQKLLEYGKYQGLGQWRGSGRYGQFEVLVK